PAAQGPAAQQPVFTFPSRCHTRPCNAVYLQWQPRRKETAMSNLAFKNDWPDDAELSTLAEWVEQAAWRDAMQAAPSWLLATCGIHACNIGDALLLVSCDSKSLLFNRVIGLG